MTTRAWLFAAVATMQVAAVSAQERVVYKCPGNLYTDTLTAKEAAAQGCKTLEGAPVTVIQGPQRRGPAPSTDSASRGADSRVDPNDQRSRDSDKRRILDAELRREEERLAALKKEYNGGQPERRGDEKNYQKYLDRTAELKASVERSESDVAALRRELAKLPAP
ncbi:MAG TPA: hypothetical protein VFR90_14345 [Methylibium sp.]|uniref:hypothetical protein n=1 Tax=Methylibium sp. TaxID=2067992 RepID=UPI002DB5B567|nr:hypothetical protein [Methylibium sp.]HEU4460296.1 hypothetical protein [Methylibium sp.]